MEITNTHRIANDIYVVWLFPILRLRGGRHEVKILCAHADEPRLLRSHLSLSWLCKCTTSSHTERDQSVLDQHSLLTTNHPTQATSCPSTQLLSHGFQQWASHVKQAHNAQQQNSGHQPSRMTSQGRERSVRRMCLHKEENTHAQFAQNLRMPPYHTGTGRNSKINRQMLTQKFTNSLNHSVTSWDDPHFSLNSCETMVSIPEFGPVVGATA